MSHIGTRTTESDGEHWVEDQHGNRISGPFKTGEEALEVSKKASHWSQPQYHASVREAKRRSRGEQTVVKDALAEKRMEAHSGRVKAHAASLARRDRPKADTFPGYPEVDFHTMPFFRERTGVYALDPKGKPAVLVSKADPEVIAHEFSHYEQSRPYLNMNKATHPEGYREGWWQQLEEAYYEAAKSMQEKDPTKMAAAVALLRKIFPKDPHASTDKDYLEWALNPVEQQAERGADYYLDYVKQSGPRRRSVNMPMQHVLQAWKATEGLPNYYSSVAKKKK